MNVELNKILEENDEVNTHVPVVYIAIDRKNWFAYIGSSNDGLQRKSKHLSLLRNGRHTDYFQAAFDEVGEENFAFRVLEYVDDVNEILNRERFWIKKIQFENLYNISENPGTTLGVKHKPETKQRLSKLHKGKKISDEHRQKIINSRVSKPIIATEETGIEIVYSGIREAARNLGCSSSGITAALRGRQKTACNCRKFRYLK